MSFKSITDAHPFPSYEEIVANIHAWPDKKESKRMYAEFDEEIYKQMKKVYESGLDPKLWRKFGTSLGCMDDCDIGEMHAMQTLFSLFVRFSPFAKYCDAKTNDQISTYLDGLWYDIGMWKACIPHKNYYDYDD